MSKIKNILRKSVCKECNKETTYSCEEKGCSCAVFMKAEADLTALLKSIVPTEDEMGFEIFKMLMPIGIELAKEWWTSSAYQDTKKHMASNLAKKFRKLQEQKIEEVIGK